MVQNYMESLFELFRFISSDSFFGFLVGGPCYCSDCNDKEYKSTGVVNGFRMALTTEVYITELPVFSSTS